VLLSRNGSSAGLLQALMQLNEMIQEKIQKKRNIMFYLNFHIQVETSIWAMLEFTISAMSFRDLRDSKASTNE